MESPQTPLFERFFTKAASWIADWAGSPQGFTVALAIVVIWAICGPFVGFSDLWQLAINTGTTIVTFLMVFLIQNSQNRDTRAIQVKIDELIRATQGASNSLLDLEGLSATEIEALHKRYRQIAERAKELGYDFDTGSPDLPKEKAELATIAVVAAKSTGKRQIEAAASRETQRYIG